jgi:hypothetical protein
MQKICFSLLVLFSAAAQTPRTIPFEFYGNAVWLEARVNGSRPLHFLLDTAAVSCVLNRSVADELKLPIATEFDQPNAGAGDRPTHIDIVPSVKIEFAGNLLDLPQIPALPLDEVARAYGASLDGILGRELPARYVTRIDYDSRTLVLYEPEKFVYAGRGNALPLEVRNGVPVVKARFSLPGKGALEGEFLVDAPFPGVVQFATPFIRDHDLLTAARALTSRLIPAAGVGVGGPSARQDGRIEWIELGGYTLKLPLAEFAEAKAGAFARTDIAGILGGELFRRFVVTLDCPHGRMFLEPSRQFDDAFDYDASGMAIKSTGPSHRAFVVAAVVDGTPAAESGIRQDDAILELDGRPAAALTAWSIRTELKKPGSDHTIKLRRGLSELTVKIQTRRLI